MTAPERRACEIDGAVYNRTLAGLDACLFCSCRFTARGETWEEAGAEMDDHLKETQGGKSDE